MRELAAGPSALLKLVVCSERLVVAD